MTREDLIAEVKRLGAGIRKHRDSSGHELCRHHPARWGLLPEKVKPRIEVLAAINELDLRCRLRDIRRGQFLVSKRNGPKVFLSEVGCSQRGSKANIRIPSMGTAASTEDSSINF